MRRMLAEDFSVAPQIGPQDVADAAAAGFRLIVNNRPDGEEPGAPQGAQIAAAAQAAGIGYVEIPVGHGGFAVDQVDALALAMDQCDGPILAYCRSGTRSAHLWAMARAARGDDPQGLIMAAARAGYDIAGIAPTLENFAESAARR